MNPAQASHGATRFNTGSGKPRWDGTFGEFPLDATFQAVNVDGRCFFAPRSRIQPHVLAGGSMPFLRVKEGDFLDPVRATRASAAGASTPRSV